MAGASKRALQASMQALVQHDRRLAYSTILRDRYIDEMETELDRLCLEFLARQQPVAGHLRLVFATLQINRALERIGDYAESIARQVLALKDVSQPSYDQFTELSSLSLQMLDDALKAFLQRDAELASRTMAMEERTNSLRNSINMNLMDLSVQGQLPATALAPLSTIARRLERVGDQAKNMCEDVLYMCTGEFAKHKGGEIFRILFIDEGNGPLSQMAEAIGTSLAIPKFSFASAGLRTQELDPDLLSFLAGKGLDSSGRASKSLEQVPNWENSQVLIFFSDQTREQLNLPAGKAISFTWSIPFPRQARPGQTAGTGFEAAYQALESHIRELVNAISEEPKPGT